jgi:hypothetical protein
MIPYPTSIPRGIRLNSGRAAYTPDADPGHSPIVLVMFATFSDNPATPVSAGNDRNVPPPAIELIAAATNAASAMRIKVMIGA